MCWEIGSSSISKIPTKCWDFGVWEIVFWEITNEPSNLPNTHLQNENLYILRISPSPLLGMQCIVVVEMTLFLS